MKKVIILLIIPVFLGFKTGDEFDEKKMQRDLEIAKNILATLVKSGSNSFFGSTSIDASYIKEYGVVFTIPEHLVYFHTGGRVMVIPEIPPIPDVDVDVYFYDDVEFSEEDADRAKQEMKKQKQIMKEHEKELKKQQWEVQKHVEEFDNAREEMAIAREETRAALADEREMRDFYVGTGNTEEIDWEEIMITFMTDYADLIGQLQPNEKIVINQKSPYNEMVVVWSDAGSDKKIEENGSNISAEVFRKDIEAYKSGKIKKDEFIKRITVNKKDPQRKIPDLEMFSNIFDRFYSHDLTETFYSQGTPRYEVLDGFGVVFHIKTSSGSNSWSRVRYYGSGGNSFSVKADKQESKDEEVYPKFREDIKAFMLDYGRTIRSLKDDDKILLDIDINSCRECSIPKSIEVSTKMSLLKQYDQQKVSRDKALGQIEIKEYY